MHNLSRLCQGWPGYEDPADGKYKYYYLLYFEEYFKKSINQLQEKNNYGIGTVNGKMLHSCTFEKFYTATLLVTRSLSR